MSEYQYYEFQAIDRPLTLPEQRAVAKLSSRVTPHPRRAVFVYHWSGLPARAEHLVLTYYDAMLYLTNWGSRQLIFRFPDHLVYPAAMRAYDVRSHAERPTPIVTVTQENDYALLNIELHEREGLGWVEGEGWLDSMLSLRDEILREDYRVLYLAWLKGTTLAWEPDLDAQEPPVPPGLQNLTPAQESFAEFVELDRDLLAVAAQASPDRDADRPPDIVREAIDRLPTAEKAEFLWRLAQGEPHLTLALHRRLDEILGIDRADGTRARTAGELLAAADARAKQREAARRADEAAQYRAELESLAARGFEPWREVNAFIEQKKTSAYREAVALLTKLKDAAVHMDTEWDFEAHITQIVEKYSRRTALMRLMREAGLIPNNRSES